MWTLYQLACPPDSDSWPLYHVQASLHVFVCVCCTSSSVFLTASTWHRAKFVVQLCHGELPLFFWILTKEYPPNPIGQVILRMMRWISPGFQRIVRPTKMASAAFVNHHCCATAWNFRRKPIHERSWSSRCELYRSVRSHSWWPLLTLASLNAFLWTTFNGFLPLWKALFGRHFLSCVTMEILRMRCQIWLLLTRTPSIGPSSPNVHKILHWGTLVMETAQKRPVLVSVCMKTAENLFFQKHASNLGDAIVTMAWRRRLKINFCFAN